MTEKAKHFDAWVIMLKCLDTFIMTGEAKKFQRPCLDFKFIDFDDYFWFISYSKCSNWCQISKLLSNCGCLFSFCYSAGAN